MKKTITATPTRTRTVEGYLQIEDPLPRFDQTFPAQETFSTSPALSYDHGLTGSTLLRVLATEAGELFTHALASSLSTTRTGQFVNSTWTKFAGLTLKAGSRVATCDGRVFYQREDGGCYYADWNGTAFGTPVPIAVIMSPVSFAPVSKTVLFVIEAKNVSPMPVTNYQMTRRDLTAGSSEVMPGYVYTTGTKAPISAALSTADANYLYFTVDEEKRTMFLKYSTRSREWSEVQPVIPLDIVDDTSQFRLTGAFAGERGPVISGVLKRTYGMDMHVYLQGPDSFSMGRELFIRPEQTTGTGKFAVLADGGVWYIGPAIRWRSERRGVFGNGAGLAQVAPAQIRLDLASNRAYSLQADLPASFTDSRLVPGALVYPYLKIGGQWAAMGPFNVDAVTRPRTADGQELAISARSEAMKRLAQWRSDASYDYWSQTKLSANPAELTKVLRVSGTWEERSGAISQEALNVDGVLYMNAKACRGAEMRARFTPVSGDFKTRFGVAVNFYRETKYEAATRLEIKSEEVQDDQCGMNGIFAVYGPTEHAGASGVGLYHVHDNAWEKLTSAALSIAGNTAHWLMVRFLEGHIVVWHREDATYGWLYLCDHNLLAANYNPWKRDQIGRGAVYLRPVTPYSFCYAFASDQDIVPVEDNSTFNAADVVKVDSEQILYSGKSPNTNIQGLQFRFGDLVASGATPGGREISFANFRASARLIQTFGLTATCFVRALKVWVKKVNFPVDGLHGGFWRGPAEEAIPLGVQVNEKIIPSEQITSEGGWVTFKFDGTEIHDGDWFILARGNNPTHPESQTHYAAAVPATGTGAHLWDEQEDLWINQNGCAAFEIYGADAEPSQWYSVYVAPHPSLSTTPNAYNNQALVVTDGEGKGSCFKIVGYQYRANKPCIFYVDRNPQMLDESSVLAVVPTLLVSKTAGRLNRGANATLAAAHGTGRQVDTYRAAPYIKCDRVEYYSSDPDRTLEDMTRVIARKAGVKDVNANGPYLYSQTGTTFAGSFEATNVIVDIDVTSLTSGEVTVYTRCTASGQADGVYLAIRSDGFLRYGKGAATRDVILYEGAYPPGNRNTGQWRVSFFDNAISVWHDGRFEHSFTMTEADAALTGKWAGVASTSTGTISVRVAEPNKRIDNFILDAGRSGEQLIGELIGEKRFFYQDHGDGTLRLFQKRETVNSAGSPYALAASEDETESDGTLATRVRLEGAEVREKLDTALMIQHGNLFYQANMHEINSVADAEYYAGKLLEDFSTQAVTKRFSGAADPRIEPGDQIYVSIAGNGGTGVPGGTGSSVKLLIVDRIGFTMSVNDTGAAFDMDIDGRVTGGG